MQATRSIVLALVLTVPLVLVSPAGATASPLEVDAGNSQVAFAGGSLALRGVARGGVGDYSFAWSHAGGEAWRFADPASAATTFDVSGLPVGDVVLTLTVTDGAGATASDSVRHRVDESPILRDSRVAVQAGAPDELGGLGLDAKTVFFTVPADTLRFTVRLEWPEAHYDLDLDVLRPDGSSATGDAGKTTANPEVVAVEAPAPGRWTARVEPFASGPTTARVVVQAFRAGAMPVVEAHGPYRFGALDAQSLSASATGGSAPYAFAWDLDLDGFYETPGQQIVASLPQDSHVVGVRVTDAAGFEVGALAQVHVLDSDHVLRLRCGGDPSAHLWSMEFTSTKGSCWIHGGHHTYFSPDRVLKLRGLDGFAFAVEQQFSPPSETHPDDPVFDSPMHVEVSMDGLSWESVVLGHYALLPDPGESTALQMRQYVTFAADGLEERFRFLRVRSPLSAAQGLSGYLDHTHLDIVVDDEGAPEAPEARVASRALSCERDILEDFFDTHPCWFGGIDRYDAPSFWHTYPLGDLGRVDRVRGQFVLAPWRTDDFYQATPIVNWTITAAFVQVSADGVHWTDIGKVPTEFGHPTSFDIALSQGLDARFVRLFPEYHARYDQTSQFAPNHHPEGYFVSSSLLVDGDLPAP